MGKSWNGDYVFNSGNLTLDLLHNFFLEIGARTHKMRVYEMTDHPTAREMIGYLFVRGGVHILAYAKALEIVTDVNLAKMLPIPNLDNSRFDYTRKYIAQGLDNILYTWSETEYRDIDRIWKGTNPDTGHPFKSFSAHRRGNRYRTWTICRRNSPRELRSITTLKSSKDWSLQAFIYSLSRPG